MTKSMNKRVVNLLLVLPEEIITLITSASDFLSKIRCMFVCKQWHRLISKLIHNGDDVQFLVCNPPCVRFGVGSVDGETHWVNWMEKPDLPVKAFRERRALRCVDSSCDGLVCFQLRNGNVYICNPSTRECELVSIPEHLRDSCDLYELGFCHSSNEYKLTTFTDHTLEICTLGSPAGWRSVPLHIERSQLRNHRGEVKAATRVGGVFHWLLESGSILTFDLADEVFGSIPLPFLEADKEIYLLGCLGHCLVVTAGYINDPNSLEIWARKQDVWIKNWVIDAPQSLDQKQVYKDINFKHLSPLKLSSDGRIFMALYHTNLYSYDPRDKLVRYYRTHGLIKLRHTYTATLVSPRKLMQVGSHSKTGQERLKIEKKRSKIENHSHMGGLKKHKSVGIPHGSKSSQSLFTPEDIAGQFAEMKDQLKEELRQEKKVEKKRSNIENDSHMERLKKPKSVGRPRGSKSAQSFLTSEDVVVQFAEMKSQLKEELREEMRRENQALIHEMLAQALGTRLSSPLNIDPSNTV